MTKQVQRRRGTSTQHTSFTGAEGEISVNTTNKSIHVHDGVTAGGVETARADLDNVSSASVLSAAGITASTTELNYVDGVTSSIQTQLNAKAPVNAPTFTGTTTIPTADINGGTIDGTVIGGTTPAAITGTTITGTSATINGNIAVTGTVDGRDVAADGSKLDGIEAGADVTDTANVTAAGALMDSELTDITAVKALDQGVATTDGPTFTNTQLAAIAASKAVTAVDVFVYDTSKDSDGGAWRKRTQHTSWYNETLNTATRGSRREFPAVAVIVAEAAKVTIYDGDDPALPMWMVFPQVSNGFVNTTNSLKAVAALNGKLVRADNRGTSVGYGAGLADFVADTMRLYTNSANTNTLSSVGISGRDTWGFYGTGTSLSDYIINAYANDVAMTVLPDAPTDPATGLPVPTIACLVAETEVLMADGSTKRLDQVQPGEMVKTLEGEHKVLNWWDQGIKDVIELEFDGGHKIICTADHKIRTTTGWVEAGDLTEDHEVVVA